MSLTKPLAAALMLVFVVLGCRVACCVLRAACRAPSWRQLCWLKRLKRHMALPRGREVWLWFDLLSIPQRSRDLQIRAITSLPAYTQLCTRFIPLVRDADIWQKVHRDEPAADSTLPGGTLQTYSKRGWCKFVWPIRRVSDAPPFHAPSFSLR